MYNQKPLLGTLINWAHPLSKGLVGAWLFNENSGNKVFDLSGNGNHGAFGAGTAAPTWKPGRTGPALDFDGSDYIHCGSGPSLNLTEAFSIASWVKPNVTNAKQNIYNRGYQLNKGIYARCSDNGHFYIVIGDGITAYSRSSAYFYTTNWQHIVFTWNSSIIKIFINGCQDPNTKVASNPIVYDDNNAYIGAVWGTSQFFNGTISEVNICNRALSASEIWQLYVDPYCMFAQPMGAELMYVAPPIGAIINQFQRANLGADLYDGVLIT